MPSRLTALDTSFLHLEDGGAHMHVAAVMTFDGTPPGYDELVGAIEARLHLVPRYRQRLAFVPLGQGRPRWVDDPHFNARYHIRHTALPSPGSHEELKRLAARVFGQRLDRGRPLWELWLVEGLDGDRFALLSKTHHALVDGVSGVDIVSVLFDTDPDPAPTAPTGSPWLPRPVPTGTELLAEALLERGTVPGEALRGLRALTRAPRQATRNVAGGLAGIGAMAWAGLQPAPRSPLNVPIGPHRRYTWVDADLRRFKAVKTQLHGTVNDVVLTAVALALGRWMRGRGEPTDGITLKAMVPVSVRATDERGALGNRVAAMWAPLPVGVADPIACFNEIHHAMAGLKESGQAVGAEALTQLADFAPPTIMSQAARLQARQRYFNLVVTNVPGPQIELFLLGRPLRGLYPVVPLAQRQALGIAIMSYHGRLGFGLLADFDALPDLDDIAGHLERAIDDLARITHADDRAGRTGSRTAPTRVPS
ncbi:WS/DGAT/MGAT family O-acyltransferase [Baekduia soli]|uniref:WS/DGAT/MGAT family O-acyltransferase n=1 Tax=Baekduia soli TaxID=496014 RepID=UPI001E29ED53|nr:wax ester/triacylglycerol synthase family O-acyltransferase [Baekduia soli]